MPGLPVPIVDDIEWIRLQEKIKHAEEESQVVFAGVESGVDFDADKWIEYSRTQKISIREAPEFDAKDK